MNLGRHFQQYRFRELVKQTGNTGHLLIENGFKTLGSAETVLSLWDPNISNSRCSCRESKIGPEVLLATSIISHDKHITENSDFARVEKNLDHLIANHAIKAVFGLGINGLRGNGVEYKELSLSIRHFLNHLQTNNIPVGCRGLKTRNFLKNIGFDEDKLFLTGCPSLLLLDKDSYALPSEFSRLLVTGALIKRIDLLESSTVIDSKFLFIPQTYDSYLVGLAQSKIDKRIEIFLPTSYQKWMTKLKGWKPEVAVGTRLHGIIAAMSFGIPTILMNGDIRTQEIAELCNFQSTDDLVELKSVIEQSDRHFDLDKAQFLEGLKREFASCLDKSNNRIQ